MMTLERGVVVAGRYTLDRPLARGGMGSVWIARHRELDIDVTVKFMAPSLVGSVEMRTRFEREAKVAARLRSQHVVHVLDYGVESSAEGEMPFIVMELLEGESLADRLASAGRLPLPAAVSLLKQICKALRTAHEAGLVHRDLKPGNIFLARKDEEEVVKVLDFGIAKVAEGTGEAQADTATGVMMGSVHYMSPEQIRSSRKVDHRSDLWSVGVILYKVLTGELPFPGTISGDVLVRVCTDTFPSPSFVVPELPASIDGFFSRALTRDPAERFQSAQEMAEAFVVTASGFPAVARDAKKTMPFGALTGTLPLAALTGTQPLLGPRATTPFPIPRPPLPSVSELEQAFQQGEMAAANQAAGVWPGASAVDRAGTDAAAGTFQAVTAPRPFPLEQPNETAVRRRSATRRLAVFATVVALVGVASVALLVLSAREQEANEQRTASTAPSAAPTVSAADSLDNAMPTATSSAAAPPPTSMPSASVSPTAPTRTVPAVASSQAPRIITSSQAPTNIKKPKGNVLDRSD